MSKALSKINEKIDLEFLLNKKEDIYFERKGIFNNKGEINLSISKIVNSIIGMLNAEGGVIILGINNGNIEDLKLLNNTKFNDFKQVALDISPACDIKIEEINIEGKTIILYHIDIEKERIFSRKDNEDIYLRIGDETRLLNRDQVKKLEYDRHTRKYEDEIIKDFLEEDFDLEMINKYAKTVNKTDIDFRELFRLKGLAIKKDGKYFYKNSCILLFSKYPEIYIPSASLRYLRIDGKELKPGNEFNIIKDEKFENNIPTIIEKIKIFLNGAFKDYFYFDIKTGKFHKILEYPEGAWLEGVVNALTHRSYNLQGNVIYIKHFNDRLEISNSGPLPTGVTVENIKNERFSRNPYIAKILYDLGYVREFNEGAKRIFKSMEETFLPEPIYKDENDIVTLILKNKVFKSDETISEETMRKIEKTFKDLNNTQKNILNIIIIFKKVNIELIIKNLELKERTIREHLNYLIGLGLIEKIGGIRDKNAEYIIKK